MLTHSLLGPVCRLTLDLYVESIAFIVLLVSLVLSLLHTASSTQAAKVVYSISADIRSYTNRFWRTSEYKFKYNHEGLKLCRRPIFVSVFLDPTVSSFLFSLCQRPTP